MGHEISRLLTVYMLVTLAQTTPDSVVTQGRRSEKNSGGLKGSDGETRIRVAGGVLLGANPRKSCNRFPNNYNAEFGLKQHLICGAKLAYVHFHFLSP